MPMVGGALDRRVLRTLNVSMDNEQVRAYMCFFCSERHVPSAPFHHRNFAKLRGAIEKSTWSHILEVMLGWSRKTKGEFIQKWNAYLNFKRFAERYAAGWKHGNTGSSCECDREYGFVYDSWERKRTCNF